jgi:hypothetical protein
MLGKENVYFALIRIPPSNMNFMSLFESGYDPNTWFLVLFHQGLTVDLSLSGRRPSKHEYYTGVHGPQEFK